MKTITKLGATAFISAFLGQGNIALADTMQVDLSTKIAVGSFGKQVAPTALKASVNDLVQLRAEQQYSMASDDKEKLDELIEALNKLADAENSNEFSKVFGWISTVSGIIVASVLTASGINSSVGAVLLAFVLDQLGQQQHSTSSAILSGSVVSVASINNTAKAGTKTALASSSLTKNVTLYQHYGYGGYSVNLGLGSYTLSSLISRGVTNDDISSLTVPAGYKVTVYEHDNFGGRATQYTSNTSWFDEQHNDQLSSIKVERIIQPGIYQIRSKISDKCLSVQYASLSNSANIQQWSCTDVANKNWIFQPLNDGTYQIQSVHSGKCVDVNNISQLDGENIVQYSCHSKNNQRFIAKLNSDGSFLFTAKHSNKVLDIEGYATYNGGNLHQYSTTNADNQRFYLDKSASNQNTGNSASLIQAYQIYYALREAIQNEKHSLNAESLVAANSILTLYEEQLKRQM
ncbi:hypothetical protein A9Q99_05775 [Gammaproteobacteria bacterium 45_16_T64]|nr:hypothetical protein A9Q99_05775 [Gammaproteobacteria bacterium 45_16_T64]